MCLLPQTVGLMPGACVNDKQLRCLRSDVKDYRWQIVSLTLNGTDVSSVTVIAVFMISHFL